MTRIGSNPNWRPEMFEVVPDFRNHTRNSVEFLAGPSCVEQAQYWLQSYRQMGKAEVQTAVLSPDADYCLVVFHQSLIP